MDQEVEKSRRNAIYRRLLYMVVAILAAALLPLKPAFSFQEDKGIIYIRSFEMDQKTFYVTQTDMETGIRCRSKVYIIAIRLFYGVVLHACFVSSVSDGALWYAIW